jgi:RNA polymerase sigma-70 factor (ECF subfamily)
LAEALFFNTAYKTERFVLKEEGIIASLARRDEKIFEQVFKTHVKELNAYAFTIVKDEMAAEEMVQNIFYKLWERPEKLSISGSVAAYLYRAVYNECLNYLKHLKVKKKHESHTVHQMKNQTDSASKSLVAKELQSRIHKALEQLPEQCRTIFQMSRFEELKYRDIAERLEISPKTVENQMGKALKIMRTELAEFLPFFIFLLLMLK